MIARGELLQRSKKLGYWVAEGMRYPRFLRGRGVVERNPIIPLKRVGEGGSASPSSSLKIWRGAPTHPPRWGCVIVEGSW